MLLNNKQCHLYIPVCLRSCARRTAGKRSWRVGLRRSLPCCFPDPPKRRLLKHKPMCLSLCSRPSHEQDFETHKPMSYPCYVPSPPKRRLPTHKPMSLPCCAPNLHKSRLLKHKPMSKVYILMYNHSLIED